MSIVAALCALSVVGAAQLWFARGHMVTGAHALQNIQLSINARTLVNSSATRNESIIKERLRRATAQFDAARSDLALWSPLLSHLGGLPRIGPQLAAAAPTADAAFYSSRSALGLLENLDAVRSAANGRRARAGLMTRLASTIATREGALATIAADATRANASLGLVPQHSGNAQLDRATAELRRRMPQLRAASQWMAALPALLGTHRPNHLLVLMQNPQELRATGGFAGAFDMLTMRRGHVTHTFSGADLTQEVQSVAPPLPISAYTPEGAWLVRDANWSPDFPESARTAAWLYHRDTGVQADGVVGILDTIMPTFLRVVGPVYISQYHRWVDAGNVTALSEYYVKHTSWRPTLRATTDTTRKQFLDYVTFEVVRRLDSIPLSRLPALAGAIDLGVKQHAIMLFDYRPHTQHAIELSGASGALGPGRGDMLYVVDHNLSYNKLNPYVHEDATYHITFRPGGIADAALTLRYHVSRSPSSLEGNGPMYGAWGSKHDYQDFVRVYVPAGAHLQSTGGLARWAPTPAYGLTQFAGEFIVRQGQTRIITFRYSVPAAQLIVDSSSRRYQLTVRHQPGGNIQRLRVLLDGAALSPQHQSLTLSEDRTLSAPVHAGYTLPRSAKSYPYRQVGDPYVVATYRRAAARYP